MFVSFNRNTRGDTREAGTVLIYESDFWNLATICDLKSASKKKGLTAMIYNITKTQTQTGTDGNLYIRACGGAVPLNSIQSQPLVTSE
jgi:hypothetical protein